MTYELAKQLRDSGWPVNPRNGATYVPTLEELIEACGEIKFTLSGGYGDDWWAHKNENEESQIIGRGSTPVEAVANLWLALNKKP